MTQHKHVTMTDARGLAGPPPARWCDCAEPRADTITTLSYPSKRQTRREVCCACGRPTEAQHLAETAKREAEAAALVPVVERCVEAIVRLARKIGQVWGVVRETVAPFMREAVEAGVPEVTIQRMLAENFRCVAAWKVQGPYSNMIRRWQHHEPWSPWMWLPPIAEAFDAGRPMLGVGSWQGVAVGVMLVPEGLTLDPHSEHPEVGDGQVDAGRTLVLVPYNKDPLGSVDAALCLRKATDQPVERVILVCTAATHDRVRDQIADSRMADTLARQRCAQPTKSECGSRRLETTPAAKPVPVDDVLVEMAAARPGQVIRDNLGREWVGMVTGVDLGKGRDVTDLSVLRRTDGPWELVVNETVESWPEAAIVARLHVMLAGQMRRPLPSEAAVAPAASPLATKALRESTESEVPADYEEEAMAFMECRPPRESPKPATVARAEQALGFSLDPAYAHAPGSLDAYPLGHAPGEQRFTRAMFEDKTNAFEAKPPRSIDLRSLDEVFAETAMRTVSAACQPFTVTRSVDFGCFYIGGRRGR